MGLFDAIGIAGSGLTAQRIRMDVTSENLANADTTKGAGGQPYQRQEVELGEVGAAGGFSGALSGAIAQVGGAQPAGGVQVTGIVADATPDQQVYDPGNPDANKQGYVSMPNVDTVTEMVDMMGAQRAYEADVAATQAIKGVAQQAISIGKA